ncbi:MAG: RNA methyltransferase [Oscillospiraceae bacterium]|nr:RNA methyltransferase [Oscillospiraceae bacterium]
MMIELTDLSSPEAQVYSRLTEAQLRNRLEPEKGIFIAESPKVIDVALKEGYTPLSVLLDPDNTDNAARQLISSLPEDIPVYTARTELLCQLAGFKLTRGMLCAMRRPQQRDCGMIYDMRRIAVLERIADATNIGAIFRSAAALGMDAVLLTSDCCDPLNRRALRVSMGTVLQVPWTYLPDNWQDVLHDAGYVTAAMALTDKSVPLTYGMFGDTAKLALVLGSEGDGLSRETVEACDMTVRIPMNHGVDSLNVAAAAAVAFFAAAM